MEYEIKFCASCYLSSAIDLVRAIFENHLHEKDFVLRLAVGEPGQFDVKRDGQTIYSKRDMGRPPMLEEIEPSLQGSTRVKQESSMDNACC